MSGQTCNDILTAALSEVDWHEIAANWIDEVYEAPAAEPVEADDDK